jgi:hypothetical protein
VAGDHGDQAHFPVFFLNEALTNRSDRGNTFTENSTPTMKKYIAILTVAALAAVSYAGDKASTSSPKAASADKAKSACAAKSDCAASASASADSSCCANSKVAKKDTTKKIVQSPKAAGEAGR